MASEMNIKDKLLFKDVVERIKETEWDGSSNTGPYVVELDPTAACDLACPGCISEDIINAGGKINNQRLIELGQEFIDIGVKAVILIGGGEPLVHPKVGDLIKLFGENNIQVGITSNGTMIHKHIDVIAEYADWTRISMDAGSKKLFMTLRPSKSGRNMFDIIVNNMTELAKIKKGLLGYSYLLQSPRDGEGVKENLDDLYNAALLAKDIGCDYFEIKPSYAFRGNIPHALMIHEEKFLAKAKEKIELVSELETQDFEIILAINLKYSLDGVQNEQKKLYKGCPSANLRTLVTSKGVYVCPYWRGKKDFKLGDITNQSFITLWNSENKKDVLGNLDVSKSCNFHCLRHETNLKCIDIKEGKDNSSISNLNAPNRFI